MARVNSRPSGIYDLIRKPQPAVYCYTDVETLPLVAERVSSISVSIISNLFEDILAPDKNGGV